MDTTNLQDDTDDNPENIEGELNENEVNESTTANIDANGDADNFDQNEDNQTSIDNTYTNHMKDTESNECYETNIENVLVNPKLENNSLKRESETIFENAAVNPKQETQDANEEQESNFVFIAPDSVQVEMTGDQINPDQTGFSCSVCYDTYYTIDELAEHIKEHPHLPVQCNFCDKTFNKSNEFKRHSMRHTNARPFECEVCNQNFKHKYHLTKHFQKFHDATHPVDRPYICDVCQKGFTEKRLLSKHTKNVHLRTGTEFRCPVCQKGFKEKQNMKKHARNAHSENPCDRPFECNLCHSTFKEKYNWKRHMANAHNENVEDISYLTVTPNINPEEIEYEEPQEQGIK